MQKIVHVHACVCVSRAYRTSLSLRPSSRTSSISVRRVSFESLSSSSCSSWSRATLSLSSPPVPPLPPLASAVSRVRTRRTRPDRSMARAGAIAGALLLARLCGARALFVLLPAWSSLQSLHWLLLLSDFDLVTRYYVEYTVLLFTARKKCAQAHKQQKDAHKKTKTHLFLGTPRTLDYFLMMWFVVVVDAMMESTCTHCKYVCVWVYSIRMCVVGAPHARTPANTFAHYIGTQMTVMLSKHTRPCGVSSETFCFEYRKIYGVQLSVLYYQSCWVLCVAYRECELFQ